MGKTTLIGPGIEEGREFLDLLRLASVPIKAPLWQRDDVRLRWTLDLFSPLIDDIGLKDTFLKLRETLQSADSPQGIELFDVYLYSPKDEVFRRLRQQCGRAREKYVQSIYLGKHTLEEGYIYFIK